MKFVFLITGLLRSFYDVLFPFLCEVSGLVECEFYICTTYDHEDTKFSGKSVRDQIQQILKHPSCKLCLVNSFTLDKLQHLTQREKNTAYQWYRLHSCFQFVQEQVQPNDILLRIRPDVRIQLSASEFVDRIKALPLGSALHIPEGNDCFDPLRMVSVGPCINDQIAVGSVEQMLHYCSLYSHVPFEHLQSPIVSEALLASHLKTKGVHVQRFVLPYTLCLSNCRILAIAGDSGVGKTTLVEALRKVFPYDSNLVFETDRYHKWERGHEQWKSMTHLNPDANFLEKMSDDTYMLKLGEQIQQVDYDHSTGRFTDFEPIESKPYVFLCGLHTLYKENLRSSLDLKIFLHTERNLKRFWKLRRDMTKRGYSFEKCAEQFAKRERDYELYIYPQMEHADVVVEYFSIEPLPETFDSTTPDPQVSMSLVCKASLVPCLQGFLSGLSHIREQVEKQSVRFKFQYESEYSAEFLLNQLPKKLQSIVQQVEFGYLGILQCWFLLLSFQLEEC